MTHTQYFLFNKQKKLKNLSFIDDEKLGSYMGKDYKYVKCENFVKLHENICQVLKNIQKL